MAEAKLTYGLDENGTLIHVDDAIRGKGCNCVCPDPKCKAKLVAKQGAKNKWHFAHDNGADCIGGRMTALHMLAQKIIQEEKKIRTPRYQGKHIYRSEKNIVFSEVKLEMQYQEEDVNRRPDCVGIDGDKQLWIEIKVEHGIDNAKLADIKAHGIMCIEIDLHSLLKKEYTEKDVHDILLTETGDDMREWINNPEYAADDERAREEFIQNLISEIKTEYQVSITFNQDERQYPDYIVAIREELSHLANFWMTNGTKEAAELVIYHIYNPYQDRDYVIHIEEFLVPNKDYLSFLVSAPKNQYTLDVFSAILDYDSRTSISKQNVNQKKLETLLNELLNKSNRSEEDDILVEGLTLLKNTMYPSSSNTQFF